MCFDLEYCEFKVTKLNEVREEPTTRKNRVDSILADVFSLLSLFFLTIGKTKECPATYCQIASIRVSKRAYTSSAPIYRHEHFSSNCWTT